MGRTMGKSGRIHRSNVEYFCGERGDQTSEKRERQEGSIDGFSSNPIVEEFSPCFPPHMRSK